MGVLRAPDPFPITMNVGNAPLALQTGYSSSLNSSPKIPPARFLNSRRFLSWKERYADDADFHTVC